MGYKDKYNKLVEAIKVLQETNPSDEGLQNWVNDNVPELKESEDERIRQAIIKGLSSCGKKYWGGFEVKAAIAWLEKQGEQKQEEQPRYNIGDILCDLSCNEYDKNAQLNYEIIDIKNGMYICDNGTIPVSQQDEYRLVAKKVEQKPVNRVNNDEDSVSNELREASFIFAAMQMVHKASPEERKLELIYSFEEGAKWDAAQKPTWSEEDEYRAEKLLGWLNTLINYIQGDATVSLDLYRERKQQVEIIKTWFNSLKDRSTWKPSDEQMDALEYHLKHTNENSRLYKETKKLYEQLKKLK